MLGENYASKARDYIKHKSYLCATVSTGYQQKTAKIKRRGAATVSLVTHNSGRCFKQIDSPGEAERNKRFRDGDFVAGVATATIDPTVTAPPVDHDPAASLEVSTARPAAFFVTAPTTVSSPPMAVPAPAKGAALAPVALHVGGVTPSDGLAFFRDADEDRFFEVGAVFRGLPSVRQVE